MIFFSRLSHRARASHKLGILSSFSTSAPNSSSALPLPCHRRDQYNIPHFTPLLHLHHYSSTFLLFPSPSSSSLPSFGALPSVFVSSAGLFTPPAAAFFPSSFFFTISPGSVFFCFFVGFFAAAGGGVGLSSGEAAEVEVEARGGAPGRVEGGAAAAWRERTALSFFRLVSFLVAREGGERKEEEGGGERRTV